MGENSLEVADLSEKPTLILSKKKIVSEDLGDSLNIKATYKLKFLEMNKILAPVQKTIGSFYLNETYLSFIIGKVINPTAIKVSVIIKRKNKTILSKELSSTQYKLVDVESGSKVRLSLKQFGIDLRRRKHEVTVKIEMIFNDNILNVNKPKLINRKTVTIKALKD